MGSCNLECGIWDGCAARSETALGVDATESCVELFVNILVTGVILSSLSLDSTSYISTGHETKAERMKPTLITKGNYSMHPIFSICVPSYQAS